ncbi:MAG: chorismate mutase [Lawsonibacter sp.]|nr:chorismate mutase [Lawsonibacter sp.]
MDDLTQMRREIDRIDRQIVALFEQRMAVTSQVGQYKSRRGLPVLDRGRERQLLAGKTALLDDPGLSADVTELFETILSISRRQQRRLVGRVQKADPA